LPAARVTCKNRFDAWDLVFDTLAFPLIDLDFAKDQLLLMRRSRGFLISMRNVVEQKKSVPCWGRRHLAVTCRVCRDAQRWIQLVDLG